MPVKRQITEPDRVNFITFTCHQWLPLIAQTNSYDLVYKWFDHLKRKGHYITGFVIMPNHVQALIGFRKTSTPDRAVRHRLGSNKFGTLGREERNPTLGSPLRQLQVDMFGLCL